MAPAGWAELAGGAAAATKEMGSEVRLSGLLVFSPSLEV